ncbi:MAG: hypothetical protein LBP92_05580 [Deltaproteobacteria bacterium]|jgi:hypothetical protein|nr:hypothetical protein [Deltaproteobacteria bacterium]
MRLTALSALAALGLLLMSSCVVWKFDNLLTERNPEGVPDISGSYVDSNNQRVGIGKTEFSNTFVVSPPDGQAQVRVTLEQISPKRFLVQGRLEAQTQGLPQYMLSVAEIDGRRITLYFFLGLEEKIEELGRKHDVTFEVIGFKQDAKAKEVQGALGVLTAYQSVDGVVGFFDDLFSLEGAQKVVFTKK